MAGGEDEAIISDWTMICVKLSVKLGHIAIRLDHTAVQSADVQCVREVGKNLQTKSRNSFETCIRRPSLLWWGCPRSGLFPPHSFWRSMPVTSCL